MRHSKPGPRCQRGTGIDIEDTEPVLRIVTASEPQERRGDLGHWQTISAAASPVVARIIASNYQGAA